MQRDLKPTRRCRAEQGFELGRVEIIRRRDALQGKPVLEIIRGERIRDIQREIADHPAVRKKLQMIVVPHEKTIRLA